VNRIRGLARRGTAAVVAVLALGLVATACGSSGGGTGGGATATATSDNGTPAKLAPLTILTEPIADFSTAFIAQEAGYFQKLGLTVNFNTALSTNAQVLLASGKVDLIDLPPPTALLAAGQGEDTKIIYEIESNTPAALISRQGLPTLASLQKLSSCRLATVQEGTLVYSLAKQFISSLGLHCTLVIASSVTVVAAGVASGNYDAGVVTFSTAYEAGAADPSKSHINLLIDPAEFQKMIGHTGVYPQAVYYGIASNLDNKRSSIVAFIKGLKQAQQLIKTDTSAQLASLLAGSPSWAAIPSKTIQLSLQLTSPYLGSGSPPGFISSSRWQLGLQEYKDWGLANFDPASSTNSYKARVDMSFYNAADG
jgi:ABC-type nitrate/sulfonate/bicarbonate transport system substrate-binding protein